MQHKFIIGLLVLGVGLSVVVSIVIANYYRSSMEEYYSKVAFNEAEIAADTIDGDKIAGYAKTLEKDDYYYQINDYLLKIKNTVGLEYFYVVIPEEGQMYYIWDAGTEEEGGICELGTYEDYYGDGHQIMRGAFLNPGEKTILITNNDEYGYLASAYVAILDSNGNAVALSCIDISMDMINEQISQFLITVVLFIAGIIVLFIAGYYIMLRKTVLDPIARLNRAAKSIDGEDLEALSTLQVDIRTGDELEYLSESFEHMAHDLCRYITNLTDVTAEKERIGTELNVATKIQASMLPCIFPAFPERDEFDIYASMTPAKEVGGDFYDFFLVDDDHLAMVMADVSGKGVPAALFMVIAKTLLKNSAQAGISPKAVLEKVNNQLCETNEAEMFVTVWLGILEISSGKMVCANAGHEYPAIARKGGEFELIHDKHGFVLAGMAGARYREYELQLNEGDRLFVYTDGVAEATDAHNELFGTDRMLAVLNKTLNENSEKRLIIVKNEVDAFVGSAPQFDDITMLALEMKSVSGNNKKTLETDPRVDDVDKVTQFIEDYLNESEVPTKLVVQMNIAIDEIYSNIKRYSGATASEVECEVTERAVLLRFIDNGKAYDPTEQKEPDITLSADERKIGGLGIFMVKKSMDKVEYTRHENKNVLTLTKYR